MARVLFQLPPRYARLTTSRAEKGFVRADTLHCGRQETTALKPACHLVMKILCGTDFSESANDAAEVAACLAAKWHQLLSLVHCNTDWLSPPDYPLNHPLDNQSRDMLEDEAERICGGGQPIQTKVLHGNASGHLLAEAGTDTSMIVLGAAGKGAYATSILGSVAEHVAESAGAPTLVVRNAQPLLNWLMNNKPLKVLCATDARESEDAILKELAKLLFLGPLEVECAYFMPAGPYELEVTDWRRVSSTLPVPDDEEIRAIQSKIRQRFQQAADFGPIAVHVRQSMRNPAYELVTLAESIQAELIVVGSHHKHGLHRLMHPSFSRRVLAHTATNVLCVSLSGAEKLQPPPRTSEAPAVVV